MKILAVCDTRDSFIELSGALSGTSLASAQIHCTLLHDLAVTSAMADRYDIIFMELDNALTSIPDSFKTVCNLHTGLGTVFLSSSDKFYKEALSLNADGYVTKPWKSADIERAVGNPQENNCLCRIVLNTPSGAVRVPYNDILYIDKKERAAVCHTSDGQSIITKKLRQSFSSAFSPLLRDNSFTMSGKTLIVNLKAIASFSTEKYIRMTDGQPVYPPVRDYYRLKQVWEQLNFDTSE